MLCSLILCCHLPVKSEWNRVYVFQNGIICLFLESKHCATAHWFPTSCPFFPLHHPFPLQRGRTRSWWRLRCSSPPYRRSPSATCRCRSSRGACPSWCPPCCLCWRPSSRRSSTRATTARCPTRPRASWPLSTSWGGSRSSRRSSGPSLCQVTKKIKKKGFLSCAHCGCSFSSHMGFYHSDL